MRIGIDARLYGHGLGLGRYVSKLIEHLEKQQDGHSYVIFLRRENFNLYTPSSPRFEKMLADVRWYSLAEQLFLPWIFLAARCDLIHVPHFNVPLLYPKKIIVTIHDLILIKHSQSATSAASTRSPLHHWMKYQGYRIILTMALMRASRVIAVSTSVANDVSVYFPFTAGKLRVIYEAADMLDEPRADDDELNRHVPFFLYAGNAYPHKNIPALIDAMKRVHDRYPEVTLLMCGQEDFFRDRLAGLITQRGYGTFIKHLGCVPDHRLRWLYEHAIAVVLPSQQEGFGLQILEAFLHSCPVIASRIPVYEEVAGQAAMLVDTRDVHQLERALIDVMNNKDLRTTLVEHGKDRVRNFSWSMTAKKTGGMYHESLTSYV